MIKSDLFEVNIRDIPTLFVYKCQKVLIIYILLHIRHVYNLKHSGITSLQIIIQLPFNPTPSPILITFVFLKNSHTINESYYRILKTNITLN